MSPKAKFNKSLASVTKDPYEFFGESYLARKRNHGAIRCCKVHYPAFAVLDIIPAVTDGRADRQIVGSYGALP